MRRWSLVAAVILAGSLAVWAQDARELTRQGDEAQFVESYARAIELYKAALVKNPSYTRPLVGLAECFFALEEYEEALGYVGEARRLAKEDTSVMNLEGRIRIGLGDLTGASKLFADVLVREPNNLEARFGQAELDIASGRTQQAANRYLQSLQAVPNNLKALVSLAYLYDDLGQSEASARYVELALRYHVDDPLVHLAAARQLAPTAPARAIEHLELALAMKGSYRDASLLLARLELNAGTPEPVITAMTALIARSRNDVGAWYLLGLAQKAAGRAQEAMNALSSALRLEPDNEISRLALEQIALDTLPLNDPKRKELSDYHTARGDLLRQRHYLDKALLEYRRALVLLPEAVTARLQYAAVYRASGFPKKYLKELQVLASLGKADATVKAEIEVRARELDSGVARTWGVDQYGIERTRRRLLVVSPEPEMRGSGDVRLRAEAAGLVRYLTDTLNRFDTVELVEPPDPLMSFEQAFRYARDNEIDYFLTTGASQPERSFLLEATLYLGRTATEMAAFRTYRTGNDRVRDATVLTADALMAQLPLEGVLLKREFSRGLMDLGTAHGVEPGLVLDIVKQGAPRIESTTGRLATRPEDRLGTFTVDTVDEGVAQGTVAVAGFFDRINTGDAVILPPPPPQEPEPAPKPRGLLQRLFGIGAAP